MEVKERKVKIRKMRYFSNKSQSIEDGIASIYEKMEKDEHLFKMRNIKIGKTNVSD